MDTCEMRARAAEISANVCAHMVSATIMKYGTDMITVIEPLGLAKDIENYILTGNVPQPIKVKHNG